MRITKIDDKKELFSDKKIRVAAYARVSTTEEDHRISLEAQKAYYEEVLMRFFIKIFNEIDPLKLPVKVMPF